MEWVMLKPIKLLLKSILMAIHSNFLSNGPTTCNKGHRKATRTGEPVHKFPVLVHALFRLRIMSCLQIFHFIKREPDIFSDFFKG